jgi:predicted DNA-binding protein (MmcQ/YjbR family)
VAADLRRTGRALLKYALTFPESVLDHPWGEDVVKVNTKVFVFFGVAEKDRLHVTVKLPEAGEFALTLPFTEPSGYGLGKAGWVTSTFGAGDSPPVDILKDWIDESYRAVAPKRLVRELKG